MERKLNNRGFSLVELIITIAIFAVLTSIIGITVLNQLEKAKRTKALTNADNVCTAIQTAMIDMSATEPGAFLESLKYTQDDDAAGSFTSTIMYKYLDMGDPNDLYKSMTGEEKFECYLAAIASNTLGITDSISGSMANVTVGGKSSTTLSDENQYGPMAFSMAYNGKCEILYFECVYKGYYVKIDGTNYTVDAVSGDLVFESWP